jgi:hypothetical protein
LAFQLQTCETWKREHLLSVVVVDFLFVFMCFSSSALCRLVRRHRHKPLLIRRFGHSGWRRGWAGLRRFGSGQCGRRDRRQQGSCTSSP